MLIIIKHVIYNILIFNLNVANVFMIIESQLIVTRKLV